MKKGKQLRTAILGPGGVLADAALYWVDGQYLFHTQAEQGEQIKFLSAAALREAFAKEPVDLGWLPAGVNRAGLCSRGAWMMRWHAPAIYTIRIDGRKTALRVPMPALVWFGRGRSYYLWAMKGATLEPGGRLYRAPVSNVSASGGLVCFGKNAHPDVSKGGFEATWRTFWNTYFNEDHDGGKSKAAPEKILPRLRQLAGAAAYPVADLVSMGITLDEGIARLTRGKEAAWADLD